MNLVIDDYGIFLGKTSKRITVKKRGKVISEYPFFDIEHIIIGCDGVCLSSDLVRECAEKGIPIDFLEFDEKPYASLHSPNLIGTVRTRREQLMAYYDVRSVELIKALTLGKLKNQANNLRYFTKYRKKTDPLLWDKIEIGVKDIVSLADKIRKLQGKCIQDIRQDVLNLEAHAAKAYWNSIKFLLKIEFPRREHRGGGGPVNSLLNYGYAILFAKAWSALVLAGMDPYGGFLHTDRPGKPSLVLDFMEEFRACVVDRSAFAYINRGSVIGMTENGYLDGSTRKRFADCVLGRLESEERFERRKVKLRSIIARQAQHMATSLRGERKYKPFVMSW